MNMDDFLRMFAYDHWANRACLSAMQTCDSVSNGTLAGETAVRDCVGRIAHILSAEKLWLERIRQQPQSMPVWPSSTVAECFEWAGRMVAAWRSYLTSLAPGGLDEKVEYRNSKGEAFSSRVEDVLIHVLMHSAYHRGQIAIQMRAAGMNPAYTDFIHAVRQGFLE
jgi:uncharacterized damage-inducible protein DinB